MYYIWHHIYCNLMGYNSQPYIKVKALISVLVWNDLIGQFKHYIFQTESGDGDSDSDDESDAYKPSDDDEDEDEDDEEEDSDEDYTSISEGSESGNNTSVYVLYCNYTLSSDMSQVIMQNIKEPSLYRFADGTSACY